MDYAEIKPFISEIGNPMVEVRIGSGSMKLSIVEAQQFALGVLSTCEKASTFSQIATTLNVVIGEKETERVLDALEEQTNGRR